MIREATPAPQTPHPREPSECPARNQISYHYLIWDKFSIFRLFSLSLAMVVGGSVVAQEQVPGTSLSAEALINRLRDAERKLMNVRISSEGWEEELLDGGRWERSGPITKGTSWYNGMPGSKVRFDIEREVLHWTEGPADFLEQSYSVGFDGQYGRYLEHKMGPLGSTDPVRRAVISTDMPKKLMDTWCAVTTGASLSIYFAFMHDQMSLSQGIHSTLEAGAIAQTSRDVCGGVDCVRVDLRGENGVSEVFWLDPSRGLSLLGRVKSFAARGGNPRVLEKLEVASLIEASDGVWWPKEATILIAPDDDVLPKKRIRYQASAVLANDPAFDDSVYTIPIPAGYFVKDVSGAKYFAGLPPEALEGSLEELKATADLLASQAATSMPSEQMGAGSSVEQSSGDRPREDVKQAADGTVALPSRLTRHWLAAILFAVIAVVAVIFLRRHRAGAMISVFFCALLASSLLSVAPQMAAAATNSGQLVYRQNCGIDVMYLTALYFNKQTSLSVLSKSLRAGPQLERNLSLLEIKRGLESLGLQVNALRADKPAEVLANPPPPGA